MLHSDLNSLQFVPFDAEIVSSFVSPFVELITTLLREERAATPPDAVKR